jgi:hypothetical protein
LRWWDTVHQQWQDADLPGAHYHFSPARAAGSEKVLQATPPSSWNRVLLWLLTVLMVSVVLWLCRSALLRAVRYLIWRGRAIWHIVPLPSLAPDRRKP